jgi:RNA polymerase sigma factor (sigma-70 family)
LYIQKRPDENLEGYLSTNVILRRVMKSKSDSLLISLYQKGDEGALSTLIHRHQRELFTFIFYKIIVMLKEGRYNEEGKFILWAKRISHNLIIDHFRSKAKNIKVSETTFETDEYSIFDLIREPSENIEDQLVTNQIQEDLLRMLQFLPLNQQEVIKLRFFDGLSFKEIADHTDMSINTTLGRVRYALINLRKIMGENNIILTR